MADIKVFAENLEDSTKEQIEEISSCSAFEGAKIRIMPDAHKGKGCVIGFTANLGDKACGDHCARRPHSVQSRCEARGAHGL